MKFAQVLKRLIPSLFKRLTQLSLPFILSLGVTLPAGAAGRGTSGGLTLIEAPSARASSLGEAFTAAQNDIAAFGYNPAALGSLGGGHFSFLHERGFADDAFSHFMIGSPLQKGGVGLAIGVYNGGEIELNDGVSKRTVQAQRDLTVALGYARGFGKWTAGITGKMIDSQLAETASARAFAVDLGLNYSLTPSLRFGGAIQNFGTELKYIEEGDPLPRIMRAGLAYDVTRLPLPATLFLDVPYFANEREWRPALGVELRMGPMPLRAGFRRDGRQNEFTVGTGFNFGTASLDYAFEMVGELESNHRIAFSKRFDSPFQRSENLLVKGEERPAAETTRAVGRAAQRASSLANRPATRKAPRVYVIRRGDTLGSISRKFYGHDGLWRWLAAKNGAFIDDPNNLTVGQKIVIP